MKRIDSPSKELVEDLQEFHISSPDKKDVNATADDIQRKPSEKPSVKQYLPNNDFADSKFLSFIEGSQSKSYMRKLGDWSMSYGTVQQRPEESPHRMNFGNKSNFRGGFSFNNRDGGYDNDNDDNNDYDNFNDENAETPQWKQYMVMQSQQKNERRRMQMQRVGRFNTALTLEERLKNRDERDIPANLVLTASLSDISGIPTNTFKRHSKRNMLRKSALQEAQDYEEEEEGEEEEEEEKEEHRLEEETDEEDIDPALEARGVFDNILRKQRSNCSLQLPHRPAILPNIQNIQPQVQPDSAGSTDSRSSYFGETPSSLSPGDVDLKPNNYKNSEKVEVEGMKLITPEEMGLVFDNVNGVWYKPAPKNQDVSSSRTLPEDSQSGFTSELSLRRKISKPRGYCQDGEDEEYDDTPMDVPEINPKFLSKKKDLVKMTYSDNTIDVTTVSQVNTSFRQSKRDLVSLLTEVIPPRGQDWSTQIEYVDLSNRNLGPHLVALDEMLPILRKINLNHNNLKSLQGVPKKIIELYCSDNQLSICRLDPLQHLETLDLSNNALTRIGGILSPSLHLRDVNLSHNKIKSLDKDLGKSNLTRLNLSHNRIHGTVDFAKLTKHLSPFSSWYHLEEIDLSYNKINKVYNIGHLPKLRIIRLDGNPLQEIVEKHVSNQLRTLSVLGTRGSLRRITTATTSDSPSLFPFHRLRILKCDAHRGARQWQTLPRSLEELCLQNGDTHKIPRWEIIPGSLRILALVMIKGLHHLPTDFAYKLPSLQELNLRDNELTSCYSLIAALPTLCLVKLDLRGNPLTSTKDNNSNKGLIKVIRMVCYRLSEVRM